MTTQTRNHHDYHQTFYYPLNWVEEFYWVGWIFYCFGQSIMTITKIRCVFIRMGGWIAVSIVS